MNEMARHVLIEGRVQSIGYRWAMGEQATRLGVAGWVCNRRDGSVEAMLQGSDTAVEALIRWAWKGPPAARVDAIEMDAGDGEFVGFERQPTA